MMVELAVAFCVFAMGVGIGFLVGFLINLKKLSDCELRLRRNW